MNFNFEKKGLVRSGKVFSGLFIIMIGILFFLKNIKIIDFSILHFVATYWPLFLILFGFSMIVKSHFLSFIFMIAILFAAVSYFYIGADYEHRNYIKQEVLGPNTRSLNLDLDFGAGELNVKSGDFDNLIKSSISTYDSINPNYFYSNSGDSASIVIGRNFKDNFMHLAKGSDIWDIELSGLVTHDLDLDFGAIDARIDLNNLKVDSLDIDCGASKTEIIFDNYPTKVNIDTGASSFKFLFPEGYSVKIHSEGGLVNHNLVDFTKDDSFYYSPDFSEAEYIEIIIESGVSDFSADFY